MSILNYFFIGTAFTFIIDVLLGMKIIKKHPKVAKALNQGDWGLAQRILCIIIWPIAALTFFGSFLKAYFKK